MEILCKYQNIILWCQKRLTKLPTWGYVHFVKQLLYSVIRSIAGCPRWGTILDNPAVAITKPLLWASGVVGIDDLLSHIGVEHDGYTD
jgi:hypothetical protein